MRTAILRYSDAEREGTSYDTVSAHRKLISEHGATWWGWWKKNHEPFPRDLLEYIAEFGRTQSIRVGLINRKEKECFYVATCDNCLFSNGAPLPSPDSNLTPPYYSGDEFPAWFSLTHIEDMSRARFIAEFGGVPTSDPTMYEVAHEHGELRIIPGNAWNVAPVKVQSDAILHLSDLHFGEGHGFATSRPGRGTGVDRQTLLDTIADKLDEEKIPIGAVVVSGDFISKGDANGYPLARTFLDALLERLQVERQACVVVPGNHDLWTANRDHPTRTYDHESPYRDFVEAFTPEHVGDLERINRIITPSGFDISFVSLNSSRIRSDELKNYGYVSKHRYESMLSYLREYLSARTDGGRTIVVAVVHHHLVPVLPVESPTDGSAVSVTLDAGELIDELSKAGVNYVFHGHRHFPFVGGVKRYGNSTAGSRQVGELIILGCGSSGARLDWLPPEIGKNTFSIYIPNKTSMDVSIYQYLPTVRPSLFWTGAVPLGEYPLSN